MGRCKDAKQQSQNQGGRLKIQVRVPVEMVKQTSVLVDVEVEENLLQNSSKGKLIKTVQNQAMRQLPMSIRKNLDDELPGCSTRFKWEDLIIQN